MGVNLRGRSFLKLLDFTSEEIRYLLDLSKDYKALKRAGIKHKNLEGKNIAILFEKDSTRTRCAFEVGAMDLGMGVTYLGPTGSQMGKKESIADTARVLGRMYDGIEYRGFSQSIVEELADYAGVPVWNGLTDEFHPTQILADLLTIEEKFGKKIKLVRCMPNTPALVLEGCSALVQGELVSDGEFEQVKKLFSAFGTVHEVPERMMDAVVGVSGSSPAYVFMFIEAMADAAVCAGMPREQAYKMAAQAVLGSAKMVLETGKHPAELKDMVCSPGGTTIEAVKVLEELGMRAAVMDAMDACIEKSKNL